MKSSPRSWTLLFFVALALAPASALRAADTTAVDTLQKNFAAPPDETRPNVRWWWFGPAVTKPQLEKEMNTMKQGGFGGFEVQPTYPLATDGQYPGLVNLKFLSPEFLDMLGFYRRQGQGTRPAHGPHPRQRLALRRPGDHTRRGGAIHRPGRGCPSRARPDQRGPGGGWRRTRWTRQRTHRRRAARPHPRSRRPAPRPIFLSPSPTARRPIARRFARRDAGDIL